MQINHQEQLEMVKNASNVTVGKCFRSKLEQRPQLMCCSLQVELN